MVALLLLGIGFLVWTLFPKVDGFTPGEATGIDSYEPIVVVFTRKIKPGTVEFSFSTSIEGEYTLEGNQVSFQPSTPWPNEQVIEVKLNPGARSVLGFPILKQYHWNISINPVKLLYLYPASGKAMLLSLNLATGEREQLTESAGNIQSFAVSPSGRMIVYSEKNNLNGSDVRVIDRSKKTDILLFSCQKYDCANLKFSQDDQFLAYEKMLDFSEPEVWLFSLQDQSNAQFNIIGQWGNLINWSPEGLLVFYNINLQRYEFWQIDQETVFFVYSNIGDVGAWSPDGKYFFYREEIPVTLDTPVVVPRESSLEIDNETVIFEEQFVESFSSHLIRLNIETKQITDITGSDYFEDATPSYAPDGNTILFTRRGIDVETWIPGRQLWAMNSDGGNQRQISESIEYLYGGIQWHPDGTIFAYTRTNQVDHTSPIELWIRNADGSNPVRILVDAFSPNWLP